MPKTKKLDWPQTFAHVDDVRAEIRDMVERLCELHDLTDPRKGIVSEEDKHEHAQRAVAIWWHIYARLMLWVQSHFIGYEMARLDTSCSQFLSSIRQGDIDQNSHQLELLGSLYAINSAMQREITEDHEALFDKVDFDLTDETLRRVVVQLLLSTSADSSIWRFPLSHALRALNAGEQAEFFQPAKTRRRGRPFALDQVRSAAVAHVHYLSGKGIKKHIALSRVADEIAVSPETLRDWEKRLRHDDWNEFCWEAAWIAGQIEDEPELASVDLFDTRYYGVASSIETAQHFLSGLIEGRSLDVVKKKLRELQMDSGG